MIFDLNSILWSSGILQIDRPGNPSQPSFGPQAAMDWLASVSIPAAFSDEGPFASRFRTL
jgi:hypothetical protein